MELTGERIETLASEYEQRQPLADIEREHLDVLPRTLASGDYGWRDVEWIVQWYYRRFLGAHPDEERRAGEESFGNNEYEAVHAAVSTAVDESEVEPTIEALTDLSGVDVSIASAFAQFLDPSAHLVMSCAEWTVLYEHGELDERYPDAPSVATYRQYLDRCIALRARGDFDLQTVYTAIWVAWHRDSFNG